VTPLLDVLVLGKTGQLAKSLARFRPQDWRLDFADRRQIDLVSPDTAALAVMERKPALVINAAAYTAVDQAEAEPELAMRINGQAPGSIAQACAELNVPFVTISTDYVFDGTKHDAYSEEDEVCPVSVYGLSKAEGERQVRAAHNWHLILRTSWVFSAFGRNFVRTMLRLSEKEQVVNVVADQRGRPTAASDLAAAVITASGTLLRDRTVAGTYHVANAGAASWQAFATAIFGGAKERGLRVPKVHAIDSSEYRTPARRPANSELATGKFERIFGLELRHWREPLAEVLDELLVCPPASPSVEVE